MMSYRSIFLFLTLCHFGSPFVAIPRFSEESTVSLSPQGDYGGQIQSRFIPLPFGGFGFFQNKPNVKRDLATLQAQVAQLTADVAQLMAYENRVQSIIQLLNTNGINSTTLIDAFGNIPKCPNRASRIGGKLVGSFCYTVSTVKLDFDRALLSCNLLGGTLAEVPSLSEASMEFYNAIAEKFPTEFGQIALNPIPGTLWIGYRQANAAPDLDFTAEYSQRIVPFPNNPLFSGTDPTEQNGAAIEKGGKTWIGLVQGTQLPYICQYFLI